MTPDWRHPTIARSEGVLFHRHATLEHVTARCGSGLHYLATPYTRLARDRAGRFCPARSLDAGIFAADWAAALARRGVRVTSPIAQAVLMVGAGRARALGPDPFDDDFWADWCRPMLAACDSVIVPPIAGWPQSRGIFAEVLQALDWGRPVHVIARGDP